MPLENLGWNWTSRRGTVVVTGCMGLLNLARTATAEPLRKIPNHDPDDQLTHFIR
jgi:hypothetical protein